MRIYIGKWCMECKVRAGGGYGPQLTAMARNSERSRMGGLRKRRMPCSRCLSCRSSSRNDTGIGSYITCIDIYIYVTAHTRVSA